MAWQTPKTNWTAQDSMTPSELNRIEGNIAALKKASTIDIQDAAGNFAATNVEDALQELAGNVKNGKTNIANAITAMGQSASGNDTFDTLAAKIKNISKDATAAEGDVLSGKTFYAGGVKKTGTMPNRGAVIITPSTQNQTIAQGYHNGSGYVKGDANLIASNIKEGVTIFGVTGSLVPRKFASGSQTLTNASNATFTVSGLTFRPYLVVISAAIHNRPYYEGIFYALADTDIFRRASGTTGNFVHFRRIGNDYSFSINTLSSITNDGFSITIAGNFASITLYWYAFG